MCNIIVSVGPGPPPPDTHQLAHHVTHRLSAIHSSDNAYLYLCFVNQSPERARVLKAGLTSGAVLAKFAPYTKCAL